MASGPHLTPVERAAVGKSARKQAPRRLLADWEPRADRADPVALLEAQGTTRVPELVPIRYGRMLASPFAFYRGSAAIMAADLAPSPTSGLTVQACGDAHLSNFGLFASPERTLVFDLNDFDETLPGPWEWDLKRLAASLAIAGRHNGFSEDERRRIVRGAAGAYRRTIGELADQTEPGGLVHALGRAERPASAAGDARQEGCRAGREGREEGDVEGSRPGGGAHSPTSWTASHGSSTTPRWWSRSSISSQRMRPRPSAKPCTECVNGYRRTLTSAPPTARDLPLRRTWPARWSASAASAPEPGSSS